MKPKANIEYRATADLKLLEHNPRTIKKADFEKLKTSIKNNAEFFEARPIILSDRTGELVVIAGNQRLRASRELGVEQVPTVLLQGLTEEKEREIIIRDNVSNGDWDMDILMNEWDITDLNDWGIGLSQWGGERSEDYEEFEDKFKVKLTTDDCYTPNEVYKAVEKWVREKFPEIRDLKTVRPFKPNGNYEAENYNGAVVIDNPPFSILSEIVRWYEAHAVPFFLFAPSTTAGTTAFGEPVAKVLTNVAVTYENGAVVPTNFITNLDKVNALIMAGSLRRAIEEAQPSDAVELPKYNRPKNLFTTLDFSTGLNTYHDWAIPHSEARFVRNVEAMKQIGKCLYGAGVLISDAMAEKAMAEKAMAEKAMAEKAMAEKVAIDIELNDEELAIVAELNHNHAHETE